MRIGILGAGISGLSSALLIKEAGMGDISLFEKESYPGGLASSSIVNGYTFDRHGGHVFNSNNADVKSWIFEKMPLEKWLHHERKARCLYKGRLIDYPFEFALYQLPPEEGVDCLRGFQEAGRGEEPDNYYDWLLWRFGRPIAEKYMIPYNEKIMSYDLSCMSTRWARGKMPLPSCKEVEHAFNARNSQERGMPHSFFYYPREGGIQSLMNHLAAGLAGSLQLNTPVQSVEHKDGVWIVNGQYRFERLISTLPLNGLVRVMPQAPSDVKRAALGLRTNATSITLCECAPQDMSWMYIPDKRVPVHRMVFQGALAPANCPAGGMGSSVLLESTGKIKPEDQVRGCNQKIAMDSLRVGSIIAHNYAEAYIVYDKDYGDNIAVINHYLDSLGCYRVGRFAEWQYYNMDVCVGKAMALVERLAFDLKGGRP